MKYIKLTNIKQQGACWWGFHTGFPFRSCYFFHLWNIQAKVPGRCLWNSKKKSKISILKKTVSVSLCNLRYTQRFPQKLSGNLV